MEKFCSRFKLIKADFILKEELFELIPATPLLSQAVVLGDRRTFSVYDLTQQVTFGTVRSLNLLIRWKSSEGGWQKQRLTPVSERRCWLYGSIKMDLQKDVSV